MALGDLAPVSLATPRARRSTVPTGSRVSSDDARAMRRNVSVSRRQSRSRSAAGPGVSAMAANKWAVVMLSRRSEANSSARFRSAGSSLVEVRLVIVGLIVASPNPLGPTSRLAHLVLRCPPCVRFPSRPIHTPSVRTGLLTPGFNQAVTAVAERETNNSWVGFSLLALLDSSDLG